MISGDMLQLKLFSILIRILVLTTLMGMLVGCGGSSSSPPPKSEPSPGGTPPQGQASDVATSSAGGGAGTTSGGSGGVGPGVGSSGGATGGGTTRPGSSGGISSDTADLSPSEFRKHQSLNRPFSDFSELAGYNEVKGKYEPGDSYSGAARGKVVFEEACVLCHSLEGAPIRTTPALSRANIPHLANVADYRYGASPKSIYRTVAYGTPNAVKGRFAEVLTEDQIWDVVHYVRSLHQ